MNFITVVGDGKDSHFEINLLQHCLNLLNNIEMSPDVRYQTSLILTSLQNEKITSFLTTFLTQISREKYMELYYESTTDIRNTEKLLLCGRD